MNKSKLIILILLIQILGCRENIYLVKRPDFRIVQEIELSGKIRKIYNDNLYYWITTAENGIYCINKGDYTVENFSPINKLLSNRVYSFAIDGNDVWIGTDMGLNLINTNTRPFSISYFTTSEGYIPEGKIWSIKVDNDFIWFGNNPDIIVYIKNPDITLKPDKGRLGGIIGRKWATFTREDGIIGDRINVIEVSPEDVWFGTNSGVMRFLKYFESFEFYNKENKLQEKDGIIFVSRMVLRIIE
jgi:ligand-binding sensor domain-containing protein